MPLPWVSSHTVSGRQLASLLGDRHFIPQGRGGHSSPQIPRDTDPVVTAAAQGREGGREEAC